MPRFFEFGRTATTTRLLDGAFAPGERIAISRLARESTVCPSIAGLRFPVMASGGRHDLPKTRNGEEAGEVDWAKGPSRYGVLLHHRATIWRVLPGEWMNDALIAFAFDGKPQDIDRFRNEPFGGALRHDFAQEQQRSSGRWTSTRQGL